MTATRHLYLQSHSQAQTQQVAAKLAQHLRAGDVLAIEGELGAGKTVFVRGLAEGLGINPASVSSPTFVIQHEYASKDDSWILAHIDAYRLHGPGDLETIGWDELLGERVLRRMIMAIEWPSRIKAALPADRIDVFIEHAGPQSRSIRFSAPAALADRLLGLQDLAVEPSVESQTGPATRCRKCGASVDPHSPAFPFCSSRCKLADLGGWFRESYRISRELKANEDVED